MDSQDNNKLVIEATLENLSKVNDFVEEFLKEKECSPKVRMQLEVVVEEIFTNIANYAYGSHEGPATVRVEVDSEKKIVDITFIDNGIPYDPLAKEDPDITLDADQREIGGLGIFMVKQTMDDVKYEYRDGHNILTLKKNLKG